MIRSVLASLLAVAGLSAPAAIAQTPTSAQTPVSAGPSISVHKVDAGQIVETLVLGGTLVAREEILVAAQVEGLAISEILVEEGARVTPGQVLARLNRETLEASLAQNTAQIARAEAAIAQARSAIAEAEANQVAAANSFSRTRQLRDDGIASAETFDQRQAAARQAAARVNSAREQLNLAEADRQLARANRSDIEIRLARTDIKAPKAGIISRRTARLGAIAAGAADPLFRIIEDGAIELEADVAENLMARIRIGQTANVRPAGFGEDIQGKVRLVSPEVSRTTRLGRVRIALPDLPGLTIGAFARGNVEVARSEGLLLPLSAVQFSPAGATVQRVSDGIIATTRVTTGLRHNGVIEIRDGLRAGDTVVALAGTFLRDGDRVTPVAATN
jgi:RND family efflux transporter MFP subunit